MANSGIVSPSKYVKDISNIPSGIHTTPMVSDSFPHEHRQRTTEATNNCFLPPILAPLPTNLSYSHHGHERLRNSGDCNPYDLESPPEKSLNDGAKPQSGPLVSHIPKIDKIGSSLPSPPPCSQFLNYPSILIFPLQQEYSQAHHINHGRPHQLDVSPKRTVVFSEISRCEQGKSKVTENDVKREVPSSHTDNFCLNQVIEAGENSLKCQKRSYSNLKGSPASYPPPDYCYGNMEMASVQEKSYVMTENANYTLPPAKRMAVDTRAIAEVRGYPIIQRHHGFVDDVKQQMSESCSEKLEAEGLRACSATDIQDNGGMSEKKKNIQGNGQVSEIRLNAGSSHEVPVQSGLAGPSGRKIFECPKCGEQTETEEDRNLHMEIAHTRRFGCTACSSRFARKYDMEKHYRIVHSKIRPYRCDECQQCFGQKHHLNRHKRAVHLKERRFQCPVCSSLFSRDEHLQNHYRAVHKLWKPLKCAFCDGEFFDRGALCNHLDTFHHVKMSRIEAFADWQPGKEHKTLKADRIHEM